VFRGCVGEEMAQKSAGWTCAAIRPAGNFFVFFSHETHRFTHWDEASGAFHVRAGKKKIRGPDDDFAWATGGIFRASRIVTVGMWSNGSNEFF